MPIMETAKPGNSKTQKTRKQQKPQNQETAKPQKRVVFSTYLIGSPCIQNICFCELTKSGKSAPKAWSLLQEEV